MLRIYVTNRVMRLLNKEARRMFPKECFSALIGEQSGEYSEIKDIWIPDDLDKYSGSSFVTTPHHWAIGASEYAEEHDMHVLGSHHSHPYTYEEWNKYSMAQMLYSTCAPSHGDWEFEWSNICGITSIVQGKTGKPKTRTEFYGPAVSVKRYIIKSNGA